jgi:N-acetyl-anhydromuramyl-L-alanine amidase AmpD
MATPSSGWCSFARRVPSPNYSRGNRGRKAVVLHIAEGGEAGSVSWLTNPRSGVSSHFFISKKGRITQMVSIDDTAYTNGLTHVRANQWRDPDGNIVTPPWPGLTPPTNPIWTTITIEREGRSHDVPTSEMNAATVRLLQWIAQQIGMRYVPLVTLIGHVHIGPTHRPNCPGPHVDYAALAAAANGELQRYRVIDGIDFAAVRQAPKRSAIMAGQLAPGRMVLIDGWKDGWAHMSRLNPERDLGFIHPSLLLPV